MTAFQSYYVPQYRTTTLDVVGGLDNSQTTGIKLASIPSDVDITQPGILAITYSNPVNTTLVEWVTYTSIDGTNVLQGVTRGAEGWTAKTHDNGCTIAWVFSKSHVNQLMDALMGVTTGVKLNTPKIVTQIEDTNGNELLKLTATASAVNELTLANAATGGNPKLSATGGDTNIGITLAPKGSGVVAIDGAIMYGADAGASDDYAITVTGVSAYASGQIFSFKANTANTGAATLNVNSLGAKTIKKNYNSDLATNDILANQLVTVIYDGTNFQMLSPVANTTTVPVDGWHAVSDSWSYASASTVTVPSGAAALYTKGDRVKFTQTTVKYFVILAVTDTTLTFAVNTDYTVANAAISDISYSHEATPIGFPTSFSFTPTFSSGGGAFTNNPTVNGAKYNIIGNVAKLVIDYSYHATSGGTGDTLITIPLTALLEGAAGVGRDMANGNPVWCYMDNTTVVRSAKYDGTTIIQNSRRVRLSIAILI